MRRTVLLLLLAAFMAGSYAQGGKRHERSRGGQSQMSQEERQRMRQDMRDAYRDRSGRSERPQREMSPQERDKLRRDIEDANRDLGRAR